MPRHARKPLDHCNTFLPAERVICNFLASFIPAAFEHVEIDDVYPQNAYRTLPLASRFLDLISLYIQKTQLPLK